eukprot:s352_g42.t1
MACRIQGPLLMKACAFDTHQSYILHFGTRVKYTYRSQLLSLALLHFCFRIAVFACLMAALVVHLPCSRERLMETQVTCCWAKEKQMLQVPGHACANHCKPRPCHHHLHHARFKFA